MKAYVSVLDNPFSSVSNGNGTVVLEGLPTDEKLMFRVHHESAKINNVTIQGKTKFWSHSRFEMSLSSDLTDLGDVLIPANAFHQ